MLVSGINERGSLHSEMVQILLKGYDVGTRYHECSFTVGRRNWLMIDTVSGAKASAIIYIIAETAKANNLNPYYYFDYLLTEIPKLKEFNIPE